MHTKKMRFLKASVFCLAALSLASKGQSIRIKGTGSYNVSDSDYDKKILQQQETVATAEQIKNAGERSKINFAALLPAEELSDGATSEQREEEAEKREEDEEALTASYDNITMALNKLLAPAEGSVLQRSVRKQFTQVAERFAEDIASLASGKPATFKPSGAEQLQKKLESLPYNSEAWILATAKETLQNAGLQMTELLKTALAKEEGEGLARHVMGAIQEKFTAEGDEDDEVPSTDGLYNALAKVLEDLEEKETPEEGKPLGGGGATQAQIDAAVAEATEATEALRNDLQTARNNAEAIAQERDALQGTVEGLELQIQTARNNETAALQERDTLQTKLNRVTPAANDGEALAHACQLYAKWINNNTDISNKQLWDPVAAIKLQGDDTLADADKQTLLAVLPGYANLLRDVQTVFHGTNALQDKKDSILGLINLNEHLRDGAALNDKGNQILESVEQIPTLVLGTKDHRGINAFVGQALNQRQTDFANKWRFS